MKSHAPGGYLTCFVFHSTINDQNSTIGLPGDYFRAPDDIFVTTVVAPIATLSLPAKNTLRLRHAIALYDLCARLFLRHPYPLLRPPPGGHCASRPYSRRRAMR